MTGLIADGDVRGWRAGRVVMVMARDLGWDGPEWSDDDMEWVWSVDDATDWLNEHRAEVGHSFGWLDGSCWYLSDAEWEAMG